jgi:hypothetical protein
LVIPFRGVSGVKIKNIFGHFDIHILKKENLPKSGKSAGNKNYLGLAAKVVKPE